MRSISAFSLLRRTRISLFASTTPIGSIKSVAPEDEVSCTSPLIFARHSALTGTTYRPSRMVTMASCKYFWYDALCIILSSTSRALAEALCIFRRIEASSFDAWSDISSSDKIAPVIFSSKYLFGTSVSKYGSSDVSTEADFCRHCFNERITRSTSAIRSSSGIVRTPPACARRRGLDTSFTPPNDGAPNRPLSICASLVSFCKRVTSYSPCAGASRSARSCASTQVVSCASICNILSSSRAFSCLFIFNSPVCIYVSLVWFYKNRAF